MSEFEETIAKHKSNEHRLCYAPSLGPITAVHKFSNTTEAKVLRCTRPLGHEVLRHYDRKDLGTGPGSDHMDGACCWSPHRYPDALAGEPDPDYIKWERCVECNQKWPCDVVLVVEAMSAELGKAPG